MQYPKPFRRIAVACAIILVLSGYANAYTITVNSNTLSASNNIIDVGQYSTVNMLISGGIPPYSIIWSWLPPKPPLPTSPSNMSTELMPINGLAYAFLTIHPNSSTNISFISNNTTKNASFGQNTIYGVLSIKSHISDSNGVNANTTSYIKINPALSTPALIITDPILDMGQSISIISYENGGTPPYAYNFIISNRITNSIISSFALNTNKLIFLPNSSFSIVPLHVRVSIHDNSTTPEELTSPELNITVFPHPYSRLDIYSTYATATNVLNYGSSALVSASVSGGSGTFAYLWLFNGSSSSLSVKNTTPYSKIIELPPAGTYKIGVHATDYGTSIPYSINQGSNTLIILPASLSSSVSGNPGVASSGTDMNITFTGTTTIGNQSAWSLYVNGALYGKTDSVIHWTGKVSAGFYSFSFQNKGNNNYTAYSQSVSLNVLAPPNLTVQNITVSNAHPSLINFSNTGAVLSFFSNSSDNTRMKVIVKNVTLSSPQSPSNYTIISATIVNVSSNSSSIPIDVAYKYPCGIPSNNIAPFTYKNKTWYPVTPFSVNSSTCRVTFKVQGSSIIAILSRNAQNILFVLIAFFVLAIMILYSIIFYLRYKFKYNENKEGRT